MRIDKGNCKFRIIRFNFLGVGTKSLPLFLEGEIENELREVGRTRCLPQQWVYKMRARELIHIKEKEIA